MILVFITIPLYKKDLLKVILDISIQHLFFFKENDEQERRERSVLSSTEQRGTLVTQGK